MEQFGFGNRGIPFEDRTTEKKLLALGSKDFPCDFIYSGHGWQLPNFRLLIISDFLPQVLAKLSSGRLAFDCRSKGSAMIFLYLKYLCALLIDGIYQLPTCRKQEYVDECFQMSKLIQIAAIFILTVIPLSACVKPVACYIFNSVKRQA